MQIFETLVELPVYLKIKIEIILIYVYKICKIILTILMLELNENLSLKKCALLQKVNKAKDFIL